MASVGVLRVNVGGQWIDVGTGVPQRQVINTVTTTTFTPALTDENSMILLNNAAAITVTLPSDATMPMPVGGQVDFMQYGAGQVTFAAGSGATAVGTPSLKTRAQYSAATAKKIAANAWVVLGDMG